MSRPSNKEKDAVSNKEDGPILSIEAIEANFAAMIRKMNMDRPIKEITKENVELKCEV